MKINDGEPRALIKAADEALYTAKAKDRNKIAALGSLSE